MTDNEIKKAKAHFEYGIKCDIFQEPVLSYAKTVLLEAFEEINRLQAENERLQQYYDDMQSAIYEFREDHAKVKFFKKEIKAEAYKEFAERLKDDFCASCSTHKRYHLTIKQCRGKENPHRKWCFKMRLIDNLLKEMVGEDK